MKVIKNSPDQISLGTVIFTLIPPAEVRSSGIRSFQNRSKNNSLALCTVSVSYGTDLRKLEKLLAEKLQKIYEPHKDLYLEAPWLLRVQNLGDSGVELRAAAKVKETDIFRAQRQLNRDIKVLFDDYGAEIPFPQVVVHQGK